VQGINDTVTPFIVVFLSEHVSINYATFDDPACLKVLPESTLAEVEADSYWCLCRMLDSLLDNYTDTWPGIEKSFGQLKEIILRVDPELLAHFEKEGIDFHHIYFKWVTCLLLRQFSVKIGLRLFDTYIADDGKYFNFVMFILAAIILKFSKKFKKMRFEDMMLFQQNMPTKEWSEEDLATVIAEAFVYQNYFPK
jgi:hypothetical protein